MADLGASDLFNVKDMVFVVTGGGSGLGEWMSLALDKNGASKVFILGRREASLKDTAAKAVNRSIIPIVADVSSKDSLKAAAEAIEKQTPFINALVANSGTTGPITGVPVRDPNSSITDIQTQLWNTSFEEHSKLHNVNLLGPFYTFVALMHLLEAGNTHPDSRGKKDFIQSQLITITSVAAFNRVEMVSHMYGAGKAALEHFTRMIATQFATKGIRANTIAPGTFLTEITKPITTDDWSKPGSVASDFIPMTRTGTAEDIAGAVLFLTSRAGAYVSGNTLLIDGAVASINPGTY